jgi:glyoxylase-like metal-dependent hydrolase (beta-lactamase superfamily II)
MCDHMPSRASLPQTALGPDIPAKGYIVEEIRDRLYWVGDGLYNAMFLLHDGGVIAVDAPPALGTNYLAAVAEVTDRPITHLVYSHSHTDHIGAAHLFPSGIEIMAHEATAATLARRRDRNRPMPTFTFTGQHVLEIGGQTLRLTDHGINHEVGNLFIHAPFQRVLMLVDVIYPGWVPFKFLGLANDIQGYIEAHDHALSYAFDTFIGGHVNRPGTRRDVETAREFLHDLHAAAIAAYAGVDYAQSIAEVGSEDKWRMFEAYFGAVVAKTVDGMRDKWQHRLGGFETCIRDDAFAMCKAFAVEFPAP